MQRPGRVKRRPRPVTACLWPWLTVAYVGVMMLTVTKLHHVALRVVDPERSGTFFARTFGVSPSSVHHEAAETRSIWFDFGGVLLMLERRTPDHPLESPALVVAFGIAASTREQWEEHLRSVGVEVEGRTDYTLYFRDPDGHRLALSHWPERRARS